MLSRRRFVCGLIASLFVLLCVSPAAWAQGGAVYFPATGHHLDDTAGFLAFWQEHDGVQLLGMPVTEAFTADERTVQYFERGRLEQQTDAATGATSVQMGPIGSEYAELLYRSFAPARAQRSGAGVQFFEQTGHALREPFLSFWEARGGAATLGMPISEALWDATARGQRRVQYFERARLELNPARAGTADEVLVGDLGRELALLHGVSTASVPNRGVEAYGPAAPQDAQVSWLDQPPPTPTPPPTAVPAPKPVAKPAPKPAAAAPARPARAAATSSAGKLIVVNLSKQWLYAYENGAQVFSAPVATGRDGMNTPAGTFAVYSKTRQQTMDGVTDGEYWIVPNVPNVMYIYGGVALHGTYWHNLFGSGARPSHGCINLPLNSAAWLYNWAPVGTKVQVTY